MQSFLFTARPYLFRRSVSLGDHHTLYPPTFFVAFARINCNAALRQPKTGLVRLNTYGDVWISCPPDLVSRAIAMSSHHRDVVAAKGCKYLFLAYLFPTGAESIWKMDVSVWRPRVQLLEEGAQKYFDVPWLKHSHGLRFFFNIHSQFREIWSVMTSDSLYFSKKQWGLILEFYFWA